MYNIYHVEGGAGKNIIGTAVVRNIAKQCPENKTIVVASYPEVFVHNPSIYRLFKVGNVPYFYEDYIKNKNSKVFKLDPYNSSSVINRTEHLSDAWCNLFDMKLDKTTPELFFNKMEDRDLMVLKQQYSPNKPYIIVQTNGGLGYGDNHMKQHWYRDIPLFYYQQIINAYADRFTFIQLKNPLQLELNNTVQVNLSLRECMNLMRGAAGAICIDSMVQHVMAAFNIPSLVCWIGNSPTVFGYDLHANITSNFTFEKENLESYLDPYGLQSEGYQCPANYNPETLFDTKELVTNFEKLFLKK